MTQETRETPETHETKKELRFNPDVTVRTLPEGTKEFNRQNYFKPVRSRTKDLTIADRTRSQSAPARIPWVLPSEPERSKHLQHQLREAHEKVQNEDEIQQQTHQPIKEINLTSATERGKQILAVQKWALGEDPP